VTVRCEGYNSLLLALSRYAGKGLGEGLMSERRDSNIQLRNYARRMRAEPTDCERKLWSILRDRRIGGYKFRRQHPSPDTL
jgi:hypothetical protein